MKRLNILAPLLAFALSLSAAGKADQKLDACVKALASHPSVTIAYQLSSGGNSTEGAMTLAGDKFLLDSAPMAIWFNGATQWTYAKAQKEVSVTNPTPEELREINPMLVLDNFRKNFTTELLEAKGPTTSVRLKPRGASGGIDAAVVNIDSNTNLPKSIILTLADRRSVSIRIKSVKPNIKLNDSSFRFNKALYPGVDVIDLR